jgi:hypothetical protein
MNHLELFVWPAPGSIISVPILLFFRHRGIVSDRWYMGKPMVISNSARNGGVVEEPWDVFCNGQLCSDEGYPGALSTFEVLHRARHPAQNGYSLFGWNCDDHVEASHGLTLSGRQLLPAMLILAGGIALLATRA